MKNAIVVGVMLLAGAAGELKIPQMPRKIPTMDRSSLARFARDLGYDVTERENGSAYIEVEDEQKQKKTMDMSWSDHDTLVLRTAWNSPHTDLGDLPIINTWNQKYRFAKVSIQDKPANDEPGNTVVIMHMDQFMPVDSGDEAVKSILDRSLKLYKMSMLAFDRFFTDVYKQAMEKQQHESTEG